MCARYYSNQNVEGGGDNATSLVSVSQSLRLATLSFFPIISCNVALGGTSSTLDSVTISNEFLTNGTNSHKNAVVAVRAFAQRVSGLQGFTGKLLGSEKTQVVARSPSRAACARNRANVVLRGVHLQILYSGDIRPAPTVDPPPPCGPARGAPTAAQPSPEYPRTSPLLRKTQHTPAQAPRLETAIEGACESEPELSERRGFFMYRIPRHPARPVRAFHTRHLPMQC